MALNNNINPNDKPNSSPPKKTLDFETANSTVTTAGEYYYASNEYDISQDEYYQDEQEEDYSEDDTTEPFYNEHDYQFNGVLAPYGEFGDYFKNHDDYDYYTDDYMFGDDYYYHDDFHHGHHRDDDDDNYPNDFPPPFDYDDDDDFPPPFDTSITNTTITTTVTQPTESITLQTNSHEITQSQTQAPVLPVDEPAQVVTDVPNENQEVVDTQPINSDTTSISSTDTTTTTTGDTSSTTESSTTTLDTTSNTTENSTTTTIADTSKVATDTETTPKKPKEEPKSNITEYEGNLARNTIYIKANKDGDIEKISYQYFESGDNLSLEQSVSQIIKDGTMSGKTEIDGVKFRYSVSPNANGYDIVFLDRAIELTTLNRLLVIFAIIGGFGLIVLFGVSWLLASWAITPIAEAWEKQRQFIADASHELKTPLTVIATNTDVILANEDDTVRNQSKWISYIKSETARMSKLVQDLLYIAKSDVNEISFIMSEFDLSRTVSGICLVYETLAFEKGKILDSDIGENIMYSGDEDRIKQLINILIDNAIVHSNEGAEIMVTLSHDIKEKGRIRLTVTNTKGEDIPKGCENRIFERFFRVDQSRNHTNGSHGLGLNIAYSIVNNHHGTIEVTSTNDHVVTFTVIL